MLHLKLFYFTMNAREKPTQDYFSTALFKVLYTMIDSISLEVMEYFQMVPILNFTCHFEVVLMVLLFVISYCKPDKLSFWVTWKCHFSVISYKFWFFIQYCFKNVYCCVVISQMILNKIPQNSSHAHLSTKMTLKRQEMAWNDTNLNDVHTCQYRYLYSLSIYSASFQKCILFHCNFCAFIICEMTVKWTEHPAFLLCPSWIYW